MKNNINTSKTNELIQILNSLTGKVNDHKLTINVGKREGEGFCSVLTSASNKYVVKRIDDCFMIEDWSIIHCSMAILNPNLVHDLNIERIYNDDGLIYRYCINYTYITPIGKLDYLLEFLFE